MSYHLGDAPADWSEAYWQKYAQFRVLAEEQLDAQYNAPTTWWEKFWGMSHPGGVIPEVILGRLDRTFGAVIDSGGDQELVAKFDAEMTNILTAVQPVTADFKWVAIADVAAQLKKMAYELGALIGAAIAGGMKGAGEGTGLGVSRLVLLALGLVGGVYFFKAAVAKGLR